MTNDSSLLKKKKRFKSPENPAILPLNPIKIYIIYIFIYTYTFVSVIINMNRLQLMVEYRWQSKEFVYTSALPRKIAEPKPIKIPPRIYM